MKDPERTIKCLLIVAIELIETKQLQFILSYKFNQDHIEMLILTIRAKGGFNNNPTVV